MKIDDTSPGKGVAPVSTTRFTLVKPSATEQPEGGSASSGSVRISAETRILASVQRGPTPFNTARVDAFRAAIAAGSFTVSPKKVAEELMASVRELLVVNH